MRKYCSLSQTCLSFCLSAKIVTRRLATNYLIHKKRLYIHNVMRDTWQLPGIEGEVLENGIFL